MRTSLGRCHAAFWAVVIFVFAFCTTTVFGQEKRAADAPENVQPLAPQYASMTDEDRWTDYVRQNFAQPGAFFQTFFTALGDQTGNAPSEWGKGPDAFARRAGSEFARFTIGGTVKSAMAAGLREDTRFFPCACRGVWSRTVHAVSRTVLTYNQNGQRTLDLAGLAGLYGGPMIMTAWYPGRYTPLGYGVRQGNLAVGITTGIYLIREFRPELKGLFRHKKANVRTTEDNNYE